MYRSVVRREAAKSMDARLCSSAITGSCLAEHLKKSLGHHTILRSVEAKKVGDGQGYLSYILRAKLTWEMEDHLPKAVVIKVTSGDTVSGAFEELVWTEEQKKDPRNPMSNGIHVFHGNECEVYELIGNEPSIPIPKCYATFRGSANSPPVIIMEDLTEKASVIPSIVAGLTLPQVLQAIEALAKLHGWSLITKVDWRGRVNDKRRRDELFEPFLSVLLTGYQVVKDRYPDLFGSMDIEKVSELSSTETVNKYDEKRRMYMDDVLAHGDFWANNILYEKRTDGTVGDRLVALIDFQLAIKGCGMADIARLLTWSVTHQLRRNHIKEILRHYYTTLKSVAGDKVTATYEQLEESYHFEFSVSVLRTLAGLPILAKCMVKSEGEQRKREEKLFVERMKAAYDDALKTMAK